MTLRELGELMQHWHESASDPIYAVGSYFYGGREYPDLSVVMRAGDGIQKLLKWHAKSAADKKELKKILRGLVEYIEART